MADVSGFTELETAAEQLLAAFERCSAPGVDVEEEVEALNLGLRKALSRLALVTRGGCHCARFELPECVCPPGEGRH